ncbi:Morn repeat protein [Pandoravirus inopinatum]|uniref:Morn repeat protein n=1 Tax=Pandoravirus inopinatum TaxID=1605721 RepID=A0A0B5J6I6_9VIRU|nr:Morn repeat protein [Pandoravirus inopinatum]AJF97375.1 Morn repeat protein [Pandoravirus inopinatum]
MEQDGATALHDQGDRTARPSKRRRRHADHDAGASDPFGRLPDELVLAILAALDDPRTLALWAQTSRRHYALANDPSLWRRLCESHFGPLLHRRFIKSGKCWRWLYRAQARVASSVGVDVGATIVPACGYDHCVYWGDLKDGLPHGYGLLLQLPSRHCDPDLLPTRIKVGATDANVLTTVDIGHEGGWHNGQRHGYGVGVLAGGNQYEGDHADDKADGYGVSLWDDGSTYEGKWRDDKLDGYGVHTWPDGESYRGVFLDNQPHGYGSRSYVNGEIYRGVWRCNQRDGYGIHIDADGAAHKGEWRNDVANGFGIFTKTNGTTYRGDWLDGLRHGYGIYTKANGSRYSGWWQNNLREGRGMWEYADGSCAQGRWLHRRLDHGTVTRHRGGESPCPLDFLCAACTTIAASSEPYPMDVYQEDVDADA